MSSGTEIQTPPQEEILLFDSSGIKLAMGPELITASIDFDDAPIETYTEEEAARIFYNLSLLHDSIAKDSTYWAKFGFLSEVRDGTKHIVVPSNTALNENRAKIQQTGICNGLFVDYPGGFIEPIDFATHLSRGEIPMATLDPRYAAHDLVHRLFYANMSQQIFNRYVAASKSALKKGDEDLIGEIVGSIDLVSEGGYKTVAGGRHRIAHEYSRFMPPAAAGVYAAKDTLAQRRVVRKLEKLKIEGPASIAA